MKKDFGIKRVCGNCKTKFYDFFKDPIICPNCSTEYSLDFLFKKRSKIEINDIDHDLDEIEVDQDISEDIATDIDTDNDFSSEEIVYTVKEDGEE